MVAALLGQPVLAAVLGGLIGLMYWGLEALTMHIGSKVPISVSVGVALGGMVVRLSVVLGALVLVALLWLPGFTTALFTFVASFTIYLGLRMSTFPLTREPAGTVRAR